MVGMLLTVSIFAKISKKELITEDSPSTFGELLFAYAKETSERIEAREMRIAVLEKVVLELRHSVTELSNCKTIDFQFRRWRRNHLILSKRYMPLWSRLTMSS